MTQIAEAFVRVRPDAQNFGRELTTQAGPGIRRFENQMKNSNREMSRFSRGAIVGTGALRDLGRAAAFASLSFIGGAGLVVGIKSAISAAMDAQVVLGQTENAVKRAGLSWEAYGEQVQEAALAQAQISGFDDERLLRTFSQFVRVTKDVNQALKLNSLAANVARGRNIELEQAALLVNKALLGQAGALRRIGIDAKVGASRTELLALINEKYAGSAAKFADTAAGAQARFSVAIQNTQEAIGAELLPTLTTYLNKATEWLNDTENQAKIQKVTKVAVEETAGAVGLFGAVVSALHRPIAAIAHDARGVGGEFYSVADALGLVADKTREVMSVQEILWARSKQRQGLLATGLFGPSFPSPSATAGSTTSALTDPFADATGAPGSRGANRNERTATGLASAQASGIRARIEAAARERQAFVADTIAFANKLISESRGDTGKLQSTLQAFYGEQESLKGIFSAFSDSDRQAAEDAKQAALERAADWRRSNHEVQEAFAAARREGRLFHERFSENVRRGAEEQNARLTRQSDLGLLLLENRVQAAGLAGGPKAQRAAEIEAQRNLIGGLQDRVKFLRKMHAGQLEVTRAAGDVISARIHLRDLLKKDPKNAAGFSLQELFAEAGAEFAQYGGNIGSGPLSAQDARGAFAGTVKTHQTTVVQNFYAPVPSSQAMIDARNSAKNLK